MKYGVAVTVQETGYVEVEADCESEAKAVAEGMVAEGFVLFHETEVIESKIESRFEGRDYQ